MFSFLEQKRLLILSLIICMLISLTSCTLNIHENDGNMTIDGEYIVRNGDCLYYNKNFVDNDKRTCGIYRRQLANEIEECVYTTKEITRLFCIDNTVYYMAKEQENILLYSITNGSNSPKQESVIGSSEKINMPSEDYTDYRMYKVDNIIYLLVNSTLLKIDNGKTETVADGILSLYCNNDNIYYSAMPKNDEKFQGIFCYNMSRKENKLILSADRIEEYNKNNTKSGSDVETWHIIEHNNALYFIGATIPAVILKYDLAADSLTGFNEYAEEKWSPYAYTFTVDEDNLYYTASSEKGYVLMKASTSNTEYKALLLGAVSFMIDGDDIYYYKFNLEGQYEPRVFNLKTQEIEVL